MANERRLTSIKALFEGLTLTLGSVQLDQPIQITATIDGQPIAIDANVDGSLSITSMPNLNAAITSMPSITIADIVNLNIDSIPALSAVITSLPGLTITSMPTININRALTTSTPNMGQVNVAASSVTVIAANANRKQVEIRNQHVSGDVYLFFGATATTANGKLLQNGEEYRFPDGFTYTGIITAISANATNKPVSYMEWV